MGVLSNGIIYGLRIYYRKYDLIIMLLNETYDSPINDLHNVNLITNNEIIQKINNIKSEILENENEISINMYSNCINSQNKDEKFFIWMPFEYDKFKIMFNL